MRRIFVLSILVLMQCKKPSRYPDISCNQEFCVTQDTPPGATIPFVYNPDHPWAETQRLLITSGNRGVHIHYLYLQTGEAWGGFLEHAVRMERVNLPRDRRDPLQMGPWITAPPDHARSDYESWRNEWGNHAIYTARLRFEPPIHLAPSETGIYHMVMQMQPQLNPTWKASGIPPQTFRTAVVSLESATGFRNCNPMPAGTCWLYGPYINITWP